MLILVLGNGFALESALREEVQEKIESSFARFSSQIGKVNAYLAELNGPKKGIATRKKERVVLGRLV